MGLYNEDERYDVSEITLKTDLINEIEANQNEEE